MDLLGICQLNLVDRNKSLSIVIAKFISPVCFALPYKWNFSLFDRRPLFYQIMLPFNRLLVRTSRLSLPRTITIIPSSFALGKRYSTIPASAESPFPSEEHSSSTLYQQFKSLGSIILANIQTRLENNHESP